MGSKKKVSTKKVTRIKEIETLSKKYANQLSEFGLTKFNQTQTSNLQFKKCSIFNSDDYVLVSSCHLMGSAGN